MEIISDPSWMEQATEDPCAPLFHLFPIHGSQPASQRLEFLLFHEHRAEIWDNISFESKSTDGFCDLSARTATCKPIGACSALAKAGKSFS
jgi:hypothetical protein